MPQSPLLVRPQRPDPEGRVLSVTPQSAGWTYVGFELFDLAAGMALERQTQAREMCLVVIAGRARVRAGEQDFGTLGERSSVFAGLPWSVYVPAHSDWQVEAEGSCEIAVCAAPGVEVITPAGNWSSYPPHKHDRDAFPQETLLEETYYHRLDPKQGYGMQRIYTDDRSLDETLSFADRDVVLVPRGYHPVGAAHGYTLYYLNVMAGPKRVWRFHNDPDHEWLLKA